jgi:hypothetical protein
MKALEKWLGGSLKLKIATVAMALSSLIYLVWAIGFAEDAGVDVLVPAILFFFATDFVDAVLVFFIIGIGKTLGIIKGIWGLLTILLTIIDPSIEIMGIEITGLFQASGAALVWSVLEVIAGFCLITAVEFKKKKAGDL